MADASKLKLLARRLWLPLIAAAALLFVGFRLVVAYDHEIARHTSTFFPDHLMRITAGPAILCGILGVTCLLIRLLLADGAPSRCAWGVYAAVVCALAVVIFGVQLHVGHAKFWAHPAWTHPWTVLGTLSMLLSRAFLEDNTSHVKFGLLPFGLFGQACLWFPVLLHRPSRWGWVRPLIVQLAWGAVWLGLSIWLCKEAYRFYA
jgi:hypothetical protein